MDALQALKDLAAGSSAFSKDVQAAIAAMDKVRKQADARMPNWD